MAYTTIDDPSEYFHTRLYSGNNSGSGLAVTNNANSGNFQPDWVWIKRRDSSGSHGLHDSNRGSTKRLKSDATDAEDTNSNILASFDSNGFTIGDNSGNYNASGTYVAWQWKANGGTTTTNNDGSITSTVQANTTAGFSILTYSANATAGATVGHGLGTTPAVVILKKRSGTGDGNWMVGHKAYVGNAAENVALDGNSYVVSADDQAGSTFYRTAFTSTVFTLGDGQAGDWTGRTNRSGYTMVAYCFAEKKGFSKFGKFRGNANANGPFIYTGFKPAWLMIKNIGAGGVGYHWYIWDNKRDTINVMDNTLHADENNAENTFDQDIDFLSNGFKLRGSGVGMNPNSHDAVYFAFAEHPFVSSKGVPVTAR